MLAEGLGLLAQPINNLADGFNNFIEGIGDFFTNLIESLGNWFDDTILKIQEFGTNVGSWFEGIGDSIAQFAQDSTAYMNNLLSYINPAHENFFLWIAFVPDDAYVDYYNQRVEEIGNSKFGFIEDIKEQIEQIKEGIGSDASAPQFNINMPEKWGGQTLSIINFEPYMGILETVKMIIRIFLWLYFIFKMYKRIPNIIY